jgi:delta24(24(1))-sterol reductase
MADIGYEFGGPWGCGLIMVFSHVLMVYLWLSLENHQGGVFVPGWQELRESVGRLELGLGLGWYCGFMGVQLALARAMPGLVIRGLPVPEEGHRQLTYNCNALSCWYLTLALLGSLHFLGLFELTFLMDHFGAILLASMLAGDCVALAIYVWGLLGGRPSRLSHNHLYDFFMGSVLNPRLGPLDLKMFAEIRVSWMQLFLLTLSAALKQRQLEGQVSYSMWLMLAAHFLYANACMKGEECVPTTWDIFHEKFGWMLIFWNLSGVPFVYCFNSIYLLKNPGSSLSGAEFAVLGVVLLGAYYVWDSSQSQKNRFRMQQRGTYVPRYTFPQLPWGTLANPRYLKTEAGDCLLVDGWWQFARKIHYSADVVMAWLWAASSRGTGLLPFYYPAFFLLMILHRYTRDQARCSRKYGADWARYCQAVPCAFVPGLI